MANFPPLKERFLLSLDRSILRFKVTGAFLDYGCGKGDVAAHLIREGGWRGDLFDVSPESRAEVGRNQFLSRCAVYASVDEIPNDAYDLVILFDVIEHLPEPDRVVAGIRRMLKPGGHLAMIVPYRPSTWGWDDEFYGHLRRWKKSEVVAFLEQNQFRILELADPTFPVYRFLRWAMLSIRCGKKRMAVGSATSASAVQARTEKSAHQNSFGPAPRWVPFVPWRLINRTSLFLEGLFLGDEIYAYSEKQQ